MEVVFLLNSLRKDDVEIREGPEEEMEPPTKEEVWKSLYVTD
jgi:hypothetical protein